MQPDKHQTPWFLKPVAVILAALCVGPFAIPLLWISSSFTKRQKWYITVLLAALGLLILKSSADLYSLLLKNLDELHEVMK